MMIHVLCLNPAIDKVYRIAGFSAGEDYPGQRPEVYAGGKGVNVARVLSQLGTRVHLYAFLGETGGEFIRREMASRCDCTFLPVPGACRTTVNVIDSATGRETVITEAGPSASRADADALIGALGRRVAHGDIVCCSGSLPSGLPMDTYACVSRLCEQRGALCALDCNAATLPASIEGTRYALGKPNDRELCALLNVRRTQDADEIVALARRVMPPYGALLVSMGAAGGVWVDAGGTAYRAEAPDVRVISTVGSGDACFAGALWALSQGWPADKALRLAMACGAANAMDARPGYVDGALRTRLMERVTVHRI